MKQIFTLIFLSFHALTFAHETYFAFAEMEYDDKCSCLEISIKVSSHDLNEIAENDIENYKGLESALIDKKQIKELFKKRHFQELFNDKNLLLTYVLEYIGTRALCYR